MNFKNLFTVPEAATLISSVTGEDKFHVAYKISVRTRLGVIQFYDPYGYANDDAQAYYGIAYDDSGRVKLGFRNDIDKEGNWINFHRMDIEDLLNLFGFDPHTKKKILDARPLIEKANCPATPAPQQNSEPAPVVEDSASATEDLPMKKAALIAALEHEWPSIERDLSDASRNGLKAAAHSGTHGKWYKARARVWAVSEGKIKQAAPAHPITGAWAGGVTRHRT